MRLLRNRPVGIAVMLIVVALMAAACYPPTPAPGVAPQALAPAATATLAPQPVVTSVPVAKTEAPTAAAPAAPAITATATLTVRAVTTTLPLTTSLPTKAVTATLPSMPAAKAATAAPAATAPPTATATKVPPTATATKAPPTVTPTKIPPTATATQVPPTATATQVPPTAVPPTAVSQPEVVVPPLTLEQLQNATYSSEFVQSGVITLTNGKFELGTGTGATEKVEVTLVEPVAFGDLNGDGIEDAAVVLGTNTGGSGIFMYLHAMINDAGTPKEIAFAPMGDRVQVNGVTIEDGDIVLDVLTHAPNDPLCCPTQNVVLTYKLEGENLLLVSTMQKPTIKGSALAPVTRVITLTAPTEGQAVKTGVKVTGEVSVVPFENTLSYRVFAGSDGQIIGSGTLKVQGEQGQSGTFSAALPFTAGKEQFGRIEIMDTDVATGQILARAAVNVSFGKAMKAFSGKARSITIAAPQSGEAVSSPMPLVGAITLMPFEKNLVYRVYQDGKVIGFGPIKVEGDVDGPGTFDIQAEFKPEGIAPLSVQVLDQDMATGFVIADAWVNVVVK